MLAHTVEMSAVPQFVWMYAEAYSGYRTCVGKGCAVF